MADQQHGFQPQPGGAWGPRPVRKRLIVCCDGSWQAANHATHEIPSNVAKLCRAISKTYIDENGLAAPQIVFYDAGVATANWLDGKISGKNCGPFRHQRALPAVEIPRWLSGIIARKPDLWLTAKLYRLARGRSRRKRVRGL